AFCDVQFGGDYMVVPEKIVKFMATEVFIRRRIINIDYNAGSSNNQERLAGQQLHPRTRTEAATQDAKT
ncbi:hypothetical protein BGZ83_000499, partial [Gryganskiella cystojenkinii]